MTPTHQTQPLSLVEAERAAIVAALRHTGGNLPGASWLLGCGLSTLRRKIQGYDIEAGEWSDWAKAAGSQP